MLKIIKVEQFTEYVELGKSFARKKAPKLFDKTVRPMKPLKLGIARDLLSGVTEKNLVLSVRYFMKAHCNSKIYLESLVKDDFRYGINGEAVEKIDPEHKIIAQQQLEIKKKIYEQKQYILALNEGKKQNRKCVKLN